MRTKHGPYHSIRKISIVAIWLSTAPAFADIIQLMDDGFGSKPQPVFGQSFRATSNEPQVDTISLRWGVWSQETLTAPTIKAQLRRGSGLDGQLLATTEAVGPLPYSPFHVWIWIDFKFPSPIPVTTGQTYTLRFDVLPTTVVGGAIGMSFSDAYPGGQSFFRLGYFPSETDLDFRVLSSPEPSTLFLLAIASCGSLTWRRKRKSSP